MDDAAKLVADAQRLCGSWPARFCGLQRSGDLLALNHRANRLMDTDWTENLTPDEARAALDALNANKVPITARGARRTSEA